MKRSALAALTLFLALLTAPALAAPGDFRLGTFGGAWCDHGATFTLTERSGWVFEGTIYLPSTGEVNRLWIEQYADNSLRMIRYLDGANSGRIQMVETNPPEFRVYNGRPYVDFNAEEGGSLGCGNWRESWITIWD